MGEIIEGIGPEQQKRIDALREAGGFFWIDVSFGETSREALGKALKIPDHALDPLLDFRADTPPSRKFPGAGEHFFFYFVSSLDPVGARGGFREPLRALQVHVL